MQADGGLIVHGGELVATHLQGVSTVYCRPEDIQVVPLSQADIKGKVVQSIFLGQSQRLLVDTGGASPLQIEAPSRQRWPNGTHIGLNLPLSVLFHPEKTITTDTTKELANG